jgi:hypothetical protein
MSNDKGSNIKVKQVAAYPIALQLVRTDSSPTPIRGDIVKLVEHGFLIKTTAGPLFKVSTDWSVTFDLPVLQIRIETNCIVVKTYDSFDPQNTLGQKVYVVELHFRELSESQKKAIDDYLVESGQKKRANL